MTFNKRKNTYVWDAENRLIEVSNTAGKSKFAYDPLGRRVNISETPTGRATTTTNYLWCGVKPCQAINPLNGARNEFYAQGEIQAGRKYYYATDHLGSVTDLLDISGNNVVSIDYSPYGRKLRQTGTVQPTFGYAGMMEHQASGLNLTWYRGYDARSGRWLSEDPIRFDGGVNLYGYVGQSPINYFDPDGRFSVVHAGVAVLIVGGGYLISNGWKPVLSGKPRNEEGGFLDNKGIIGSNFNRITCFLTGICSIQEKTPNEGEANSCHVNPVSGQERQ